MTKPEVVTQDLETSTKPLLSQAAQRAANEANERRAILEQAVENAPKEINGRGGLDPARFGDWEVKGIAVDF